MKKCYFVVVFAAILLCALVLSGCGEISGPVYDAGQYSLSGAVLDGEPAELSRLYPSGGWLLLSSGGEGRLYLGQDYCDVAWQSSGSEISLQLNSLQCTGSISGDTVFLTLGDTGLELIFSTGQYSPAAAVQSAPSGGSWNGNWEGRMWFENCSGQWADYPGRTMALSGSIVLADSGEGRIRLLSPGFSKEVPLADIEISVTPLKVRSLSGYIMDYPVEAGDAAVSMARQLPSEIENTLIIVNSGDYGHYFDKSDEPEQAVDVIRISGRCADEEGAFGYRMVLTRAA